MGWRFSVNDANIIAYLTSNIEALEPPRIRRAQLQEFLRGLAESISITDRPVFIAQNSEWAERIASVADRLVVRLINEPPPDRETQQGDKQQFESGKDEQEDLVSDRFLLEDLQELKRFFDDFEIYAIPFDRPEGVFSGFARDMALKSEKVLFLIPVDSGRLERGSRQINFFDPFPAVRTLAEAGIEERGILFWTAEGRSGFLSDEYDLRYLATVMIEGPSAQRAGDILDWAEYHRRDSYRLLHLSDLHFGTNYALQNRTRLKTAIRELARENTFDRVIITGDLMDNPSERDALDFADFRSDLQYLTGRDVIVVPGNHDQKYFGNNWKAIFRNLEYVARLEWANLVVDDMSECVFFCFDSAADANFARGRFSPQDRDDAENAFALQRGRDRNIVNYHKIALIHHHPFTFETKQESYVQRTLRLVGLSDERFLKMENADMFVEWCARMGIPLILHGHKHVQRHYSKEVSITNRKKVDVTSVGCGASLGAEDHPLTFNIINLSRDSKSFSVSFFEDAKGGSGFQPVKVSRQIIA